MSDPAHAVVVGAGMAGLLAARVLASHFEHVTLVERDHLPESLQTRKGVPQGRMLHVMLPCGQQIIEHLFPGYSRELKAAGAVPLYMPADALVLSPAGWMDRRATGWPVFSASRPMFEGILRRRLRELPGVTILDRHDVAALLTSPDRRHVTGVVLRPLSGTDTDPTGGHAVAADLVVDASGRASRAHVWLSEAGPAIRLMHRYPRPVIARRHQGSAHR